MTCIYCDKEVLDDVFYLGLEIPYCNLLVHKCCWKKFRDTDFLQQNSKKIFDLLNKREKKKEKPTAIHNYVL